MSWNNGKIVQLIIFCQENIKSILKKLKKLPKIAQPAIWHCLARMGGRQGLGWALATVCESHKRLFTRVGHARVLTSHTSTLWTSLGCVLGISCSPPRVHSWLVHFLCHNRELSNTRGAIMLHLFYVDNKLADQNPKTTDKHMIRCSLSSRSWENVL